jgi:transposase
MESTGVYRRPVHNVLEEFMEVILVNARHIKNVSGRKTDIEDASGLLIFYSMDF